MLDGVYRRTGGAPVFQEARAPTGEALQGLLEKTIVRLMKKLTRRKALERLCRYISRPAIANARLKEDAAGNVVLQLKSPGRDGTTHLRMSPLRRLREFQSRYAVESGPMPGSVRRSRPLKRGRYLLIGCGMVILGIVFPWIHKAQT